MSRIRTGPVAGLVGQVVLLAGLAETVGLGIAGWLTGFACGLVTCVALTLGLRRSDAGDLGPADVVTSIRAVLVGGVAALTVDSFDGSAPVEVVVAVTVVALLLDAVDGRVARGTGTATALGARFDMEVDAFLILVLSIYVVPSTGGWVLAIGAMRYAFGVASWVLPWMRRSLPPRPWRKVVAATQGVVLAFAVANLLPRPLMIAALAGALALLLESFGRDVGWLWRHRVVPLTDPDQTGWSSAGESRGKHSIGAWVATALAGLLVLFALIAPNRVGRLTPGTFVQIPVEGLLAVALVVVLPTRARRAVAALVGLTLGLLFILKIVDMGFFAFLDRPFDPSLDWSLLDDAVGFLADSFGRAGAIGSVIAAAALVTALLVLMTLSVLRLTRIVVRHNTTATRAVAALGVAWIACAAFGVRIVPDVPVADGSATALVHDHAVQIRADLRDRKSFAAELAADAFRDTPGEDLLTGLRGKDVIVAFVESYGRDAVEDPEFAPRVGAVLDAGDRRLGAAGFASRSGFLTSSTSGGGSWLAHATLLSGLWIDNEQRHRNLLASDRLTLNGAFRRANWQTIGVMPAVTRDWPEGTFYGYDRFYDARNLGYTGPKVGYVGIPDQYTLSAFERLEHGTPDRRPLMAEIALVSSHSPWATTPRLVDWNAVGDGTVFNGAAATTGGSGEVVGRDTTEVRAGYRRSIEYSLNTLISYVERYGNDQLVLVFLGDHQPSPIITGEGASRDVPITIVTRDRTVLSRISGWGWQNGLRPGPRAPVWPMSAFRDRFLTAFGPKDPQ